MADIRAKRTDIENLEFKADLAYAILKAAVEIPEPRLIDSALKLYEHDIGGYLSNLIQPTRHPDLLNKGGQRAKKIEGFILQYVLMFNPSSKKSDRYKIKITEDPNDGMGGLKAYIDAEDQLDSGEGEVFRLIAHKAEEWRIKKRFDLILRNLDYVRKEYPSPDKSTVPQINLTIKQ